MAELASVARSHLPPNPSYPREPGGAKIDRLKSIWSWAGMYCKAIDTYLSAVRSRHKQQRRLDLPAFIDHSGQVRWDSAIGKASLTSYRS